MKLHKILLNSKGNAMVVALMMLGATTMISGGVMYSQNNLRNRIHLVRTKAKMVSVQNRFLSIVSQPLAYRGCSYDTSTVTCALDLGPTGRLDKYLTMPLRGAPCTGKETCQIRILEPELDVGTRTVRFRVTAEGVDNRLSDLVITNYKIPDDVLQLGDLHCPQVAGASNPVFKGFNDNGTPRCEPLLNPTCLDDEYVIGMNHSTGEVICSKFPDQTRSCPSGYALDSLRWTGGNSSANLTSNCFQLPNPYDAFPGGYDNINNGYTPPSGSTYTPPPIPPAPTSGSWQHETWGFSAPGNCPGISLYGASCSPVGFRCNQWHNNVGPETLVCR